MHTSPRWLVLVESGEQTLMLEHRSSLQQWLQLDCPRLPTTEPHSDMTTCVMHGGHPSKVSRLRLLQLPRADEIESISGDSIRGIINMKNQWNAYGS